MGSSRIINHSNGSILTLKLAMKFKFSFILVLTFTANTYAQQVKMTTSLGDIVVELEAEKAPATVANFIRYAKAGHYSEGSFFRTVHSHNQPNDDVKITVIQGGASADSERFDPIPLERTSKTGLKHLDGTISMARSTPDTAQDSFFICIGDQPELDFGGKRNPDGQGFAAFGQVVEGMDVVRKINHSQANGQGLTPPIVISSMVVLP
jgi:peptidyl-prolyl cis-trans isomerase A (cyclophilin A)